jgi:hypothetical protein
MKNLKKVTKAVFYYMRWSKLETYLGYEGDILCVEVD